MSLLLLLLNHAAAQGVAGAACAEHADCAETLQCIVSTKVDDPASFSVVWYKEGTGSGFCSAPYTDTSTLCTETTTGNTDAVHCPPAATADATTHFCDLASGECLPKPSAGSSCVGNLAACGAGMYESEIGAGKCYEQKEAAMKDASTRIYVRAATASSTVNAKCWGSTLKTAAGATATGEMCDAGYYSTGTVCVAKEDHVKGDSCDVFSGTVACDGANIDCVDVTTNEYNEQFYDYTKLDITSVDGKPTSFCMDQESNGATCSAKEGYCDTPNESCDFADASGAACKTTPTELPSAATSCTAAGFECGTAAGEWQCFTATVANGTSGSNHYTYTHEDGTCAKKWVEGGDACGADVYCADGKWCDSRDGECKTPIEPNTPCHNNPEEDCVDDINSLACVYLVELEDSSSNKNHYYEVATGTTPLETGPICVAGKTNASSACSIADSTDGNCHCNPTDAYNVNGTCTLLNSAEFLTGDQCGAPKNTVGCATDNYCLKYVESSDQGYYVPYPSGINDDAIAVGDADPKTCGSDCVCMTKVETSGTCSATIGCPAGDTCQSLSCDTEIAIVAGTDCAAGGHIECGLDREALECVLASEGTDATDGNTGNFTYELHAGVNLTNAKCSAPFEAGGAACDKGNVHCPAGEYCRKNVDGDNAMECVTLAEAGGVCSGTYGCDTVNWGLKCYTLWENSDASKTVFVADPSNAGTCLIGTEVSNESGSGTCKTDGTTGPCAATSYCNSTGECHEWTASALGGSCESPIPVNDKRCGSGIECVVTKDDTEKYIYDLVAADADAPAGALCMTEADNGDSSKYCNKTQNYCTAGETCDYTTTPETPVCEVEVETTTPDPPTLGPQPDLPDKNTELLCSGAKSCSAQLLGYYSECAVPVLSTLPDGVSVSITYNYHGKDATNVAGGLCLRYDPTSKDRCDEQWFMCSPGSFCEGFNETDKDGNAQGQELQWGACVDPRNSSGSTMAMATSLALMTVFSLF